MNVHALVNAARNKAAAQEAAEKQKIQCKLYDNIKHDNSIECYSNYVIAVSQVIFNFIFNLI